jgi:hypothetical protein
MDRYAPQKLTNGVKRQALQFENQSQNESQLLYNWRFTANQFILASSLLRLMTKFFFFSTEPLWS